ncbi:hypothetical protein [Acinetobacter venetianus]|uniref:hypothetical protein n=1 Tax=Acinetobacter venetianus TaxID=52133 RepID=UPI003A91E0D7
MQAYTPIDIGNISVSFNDPNLGQIIAVARLPEKKHEQKISAFLKALLKDDQLPLRLYAQQRHYLMMRFQQLQQDSFNFNIDFEKYEKNGEFLEQIEVDGYTFRQLNGYECEALELYANDYLDWFLGAMALQMSSKNIPYIQPCTDTNFAKNIIQNRMSIIYQQYLSNSENMIDSFSVANEKLNHLIDISFDDEGIVCMQQGGTDDAPCRFRALSTLPESIKNLLRGLSSKG